MIRTITATIRVMVATSEEGDLTESGVMETVAGSIGLNTNEFDLLDYEVEEDEGLNES